MYVLRSGKIGKEIRPDWRIIIIMVILTMIGMATAKGSDEFEEYDEFYAGLYQIGPWHPAILSADSYHELKVLIIEIEDGFFDDTDTSCMLFGQMLLYLTRNDWMVVITNDGWIPSEERVFDENMAKRLAKVR